METCGSTCVESICIPSYNGHQVKEMSSSTHEHAIKARKPYTITKQRERWSEEEHEKFLEALKLYGRAWRQIEEHIGTKTAVQIRSHAQKFFSKVAHDSAAAGSAAGSASVEAIVIPPPRPKRKPVHPYPRKIGHPHNLKMSIPEQAEWSYAPIPSPLERENRSPTSVLAAFPSDTAGSSVSNLPSGPTSPLSSRAGSNHVEMFNGEENHSQLPVASSEEEDRSPSPGLNNATMESDMGVEEDSSMETHAEVTTLKLFGTTVLVTDSQKHSWSDGASLQRPRPSGAIDIQSHHSGAIDIQSHHRTADISPQTEAQAPAILQKIDGDVSRFPGQSAWIPWNGQIIPMVYCSPCGDSASATDRQFGSCANSMPWCWALYGASQFEFPNGQSMSCSQDPCAQQRGSCNESALASSLTEPAPPTSLRHSVNSAFSSFPTGVSKPPRGFKPYKRCLSQKVVQNLSTDLAGDSEAIELCL